MRASVAGSAPLVSIVLPTYNHLVHLPLAIESVLSQKLADFELIVVNDGSTDGTREYLDGLADPRIRAIHQSNTRLPGALNAGMSAARGEFLTWTSADNILAPEFLQVMTAAFETYPEAGFACSAFAWIDEGNAVTRITSGQDLSYPSLLCSNPGIASFMYRRECHETLGLYDTELEGAEDWDMWIRIAERYVPVYVDEVPYYYRAHPDTMTSRMPEKIRRSCRRAFEKALGRLGGLPDAPDLYAGMRDCNDRRTAEAHANFDFGTKLLAAPSGFLDHAARYLAKAASLKPDLVGAAFNLVLAYGRAGVRELLLPAIEKLSLASPAKTSGLLDLLGPDMQGWRPEDFMKLLPMSLSPDSSEILMRSGLIRRTGGRSGRIGSIEGSQEMKNPKQPGGLAGDRARLSPDEGCTAASPGNVHFLMNDKCNARCIMCGGDYFHADGRRRITFDKFRKMAENLRLERSGGAVLAGWGDPLLNPDLLPILGHLKERYPSVRVSVTTNGIALTRRIAAAFLDHGVFHVNVSLNAGTPETYRRIMQVDRFTQVMANVAGLSEAKRERGRGPVLQLSMAINRLNIEELPLMVRLAAHFKLDSVNVMYTRFYPERIRNQGVDRPEDRLRDEDSLYHHQALSDAKVSEAAAFARTLGIAFSHEPLFRDNAPGRPCVWPEREIMVGFDGEIYPCGGAEVHFRGKVEKGIYNFGNALTQSIDEFWNGPAYRKLRLSSRGGDAASIEECRCCANTMNPGDLRSHVMQWSEEGSGGEPAVDRKEDVRMAAGRPERPLVSVIVPTHNRPEMLAATIRSILGQTYPDFEIVVVNDAGKGVEDIVAGLNRGGRIAYACHDRNRGLAAARNTGLRIARGKYIAYLDDDDTYYPDHLETLVTHLERHGCKVAYTDACRADQRKVDGEYVTVNRDIPYSQDFDREKFLVGNYVPVLCFMHEKACLEEAGYFDETLTTHEDWDLWIRMSRKYDFAHIKKVTCEFSWRTDGTTMTSGNRPDYARTLEIIYGKYRDIAQEYPHILDIQEKTLAQLKIISAQDVLRPAPGSENANGKAHPERKTDAGDPASRGRALKKEKRYVEAADLFRQAASGGDLSVLADIGDCLAQEGKIEEAGSVYEEAIAGNPRDQRALTGLGVLLLLKGFPSRAAERFSTALAVDGREATALCGMGLAMKAEGAVEEAIGWFVKSLDADPVNITALHELTKAAYELGRFTEAEGSIRAYLACRPVDSNILFSLAGILHKAGKRGEALEVLDRLAIVDADYNGAAELRSRIEEAVDGGKSGTASGCFRGDDEGTDRYAVSVIIPVFNKVEYTRKCLDALAKNTPSGLPYETILVDNASTDGTGEYLRGISGDVVVARNERNLGFAVACNQGARLARGRELVFLNNDTEPLPGWLDALLSASRSHRADICGAKLLYPNGTVQHAGVAIGPWKTGYHIFNGLPGDDPAVNRCREFQAVTGACMLVRKSVFIELGGFDEIYRNGYEDVDFCLRARKNGHRVLYVPESVLVHHEETTEGRKAHEDHNMEVFRERWAGTLDSDCDRIYAEAGMRKIVSPEGRWTLIQDSRDRSSVSGSPESVNTGGEPEQCHRPVEDDPVSRGRALKKERRYVEAIEVFRKARSRGDLAVLADIGDCLAQDGKYEEAGSAYREAITENPRDSRALAGLGVLDLVQGNTARAAERFSSVLDADGSDPTALCGMGLARKGDGGNDEAFGWFRRALDVDPVNVTALHELVKVAHELGRLEEAERYLRAYLQYKPSDSHILYSLSGVLYKAGKLDGASDAIEKLRLFSPAYEGATELEERIIAEGSGTQSQA